MQWLQFGAPKTSRVLPFERDLVDGLAVDLSACSYVQTIVDGDRIVIFTPDVDPIESAAAMTRIFASAPLSAAEWTIGQGN